METIDWETVIPAGIAITIFLGGMLMMFTNFWTDGVYQKQKRKKWYVSLVSTLQRDNLRSTMILKCSII